MTNSPKTAYLIVTQDGLDTIAETTETANNEIADLLAMGCDVVSIPVEWENQNAAESSVSDMIENGFSLTGIKRRVSNAFGSSSKLKTVIRGVTLATVVACSTAANAADLYTYKLLVNQDNKIQRVDHSVKGLTFKACDTKRARVWKDYGKANDTAFVDHGKAFPFFDAVCLPEGKKR